MQFMQIKNATLKLNYAGKKILIDPWLADKGAIPGFGGTINDHIRNPMAELPMPISEIIDVDAVILTHDHPDHWDDTATLYPKTCCFLCSTKKMHNQSSRQDLPIFECLRTIILLKALR